MKKKKKKIDVCHKNDKFEEYGRDHHVRARVGSLQPQPRLVQSGPKRSLASHVSTLAAELQTAKPPGPRPEALQAANHGQLVTLLVVVVVGSYPFTEV